jgi:hypothetical protein
LISGPGCPGVCFALQVWPVGPRLALHSSVPSSARDVRAAPWARSGVSRLVALQAGSFQAGVSGPGCARAGPVLQVGSLSLLTSARSVPRPPRHTPCAQPHGLAATSMSLAKLESPSWILGLLMRLSRPCPPSGQPGPTGHSSQCTVTSLLHTTCAMPHGLAARSCRSPSWSFPSWRLGLQMRLSRPCPPGRQASPGGHGPYISELGCAHREHSMCTPCTLCTLCTPCAHRPSDSLRPKLRF